MKMGEGQRNQHEQLKINSGHFHVKHERSHSNRKDVKVNSQQKAKMHKNKTNKKNKLKKIATKTEVSCSINPVGS